MADHHLPDLEQLHAEHQAWLAFMEQLKLHCPGLDFNEAPALHATVTLWGEELHRLRLTHDEAVRTRSYDDAVARFNEHVGFVPWH